MCRFGGAYLEGVGNGGAGRQKPYYKDCIFVHQVSKFHSMLYYEFLALSHRTVRVQVRIGGKISVM